MISPISSGCPPSADKAFADVGARPRTDDQIRGLIAYKIAKYRSSLLSQKKSTGSLLQADCIALSSSGDELPQTFTAFKDQQRLNPAADRLCSPKAVEPLEEDNSGVFRAESALNTSSKRKAYPQILSEVDATLAKNKAESPVVSTSVSVKAIDKLMENCQSSANGRKDLLHSLQGAETVLDIKEVPVARIACSNTKNQRRQAACEEERVHLTSRQSNSLGLAPITQTEQVCNKVRPEYVAEMLRSPTLKLPQYENISDEDASQLYDGKIQSTKNSAEPSTRNTEFGLQHGETKINSELRPELVSPKTERCCSCSQYVETDDDLELRLCPKCDRERDFGGQTNSCVDLEDELEGDEGDWEVIPLSICSLTFEQPENQLYPENLSQDLDSGDTLSPRLCEPAPKPVPASAFLKMDVFDTPSEQEQAVRFGQVSFVEPSSCSIPNREPQTLKRKRDSCSEHEDHEDSYDTDNSSDYSSGPENNYLTVSKQLVRSISAPVKTTADNFKLEINNNMDETRNLQKGRSLVLENSVEESIIILDSDSESDNDNCVETEREELFTSSEKRRSSTEIVESQCKVRDNFPETIPPSVDAQHCTSSTPTGKCVQNESRKKSSKDNNIIIILSDSDDDCRDVSIRAKEVSESVDSGKTAMTKDVLQDPKPSADVPKPKPANKSDQKTSRHIKSGSRDRKKDSKREKLETEDGRNDLNDSGSGLCAKRKKVKKRTACSLRREQKGEHFSEGAASSVTRPANVQASALFGGQVPLLDEARVPKEGESTLNLYMAPSKKSSFKHKSFFRDEPASKSDSTNRVPSATLVTSSQDSLKRLGLSKRHRAHSYESPKSYPLIPFRKSSSLTSTQSVQGTSHARTKVYSDWQQKHVPIRRERKIPSRHKRPKV